MALISNRLLLVTLAAVLGLAEFENAFTISFWEGAAVFSALYLLAALWSRRGGLGGPILAGALSIFELQSYPTWKSTGLDDRIFQAAFAVVSAVCVCVAVAVVAKLVADRRRAAKLVQRAVA
jgi:hypothetical protein